MKNIKSTVYRSENLISINQHDWYYNLWWFLITIKDKPSDEHIKNVEEFFWWKWEENKEK